MSEFDDREDVILRALRERIEEEGDSVRRVARFLSVHGRVIEDWVSRTRRPRRATLERIETFLNAQTLYRQSASLPARFERDPARARPFTPVREL